MKIVSMQELETMYGRHDGAPLDMEDLDISDLIVRDIMLEEVSDAVWDVIEKHISTDIYAAYSPKQTYYGKHPPVGWVRVGGRESGVYSYQRRWSLYDRDNMVTKIIGLNTLFVTSDAQPNESVVGSGWNGAVGGFIQMIGTNPGPIWRGRFARPALQNAQDDIDNNSWTQRALAEAFMTGLERYLK